MYIVLRRSDITFLIFKTVWESSAAVDSCRVDREPAAALEVPFRLLIEAPPLWSGEEGAC